ncbi:MAG: Gfo/Idh/MocA family oxidoreductase [Clostridiales bacterium]|nr:Gfo/Idh/MocA family oxidoreductase [Clostridiales bacterium]
MKLGAVGNGKIVTWLFRDVPAVPEITVTALCVREKSVEKGRELAAENGGLTLYTDYEKFLSEGDFDTVYIGIANHMHYQYVLRALRAGKHVICEKPFTVNAAEASELTALARKKQLFLWEAFKIPYSPVYAAVKEHLPEIGTLRMAQCNYSRISSRYDQYASGVVLPAFDPACAGGCLYDINVYNLHFVTLLFGRPQKLHYLANYGYNGVDTSGTAILEYGDFYAVCTGAKDSTSPSSCVLQGTDGYLQITGPSSAPESVDLVNNDGTVKRLAEDYSDGGLADELRVFASQLDAGDYASCYAMLEHSLLTMEVIDEANRAMRP